jgi:hypothetical protein
MTTIGFGDITPNNYIEVVVVSFFMLLGTLVISLNVS